MLKLPWMMVRVLNLLSECVITEMSHPRCAWLQYHGGHFCVSRSQLPEPSRNSSSGRSVLFQLSDFVIRPLADPACSPNEPGEGACLNA